MARTIRESVRGTVQGSRGRFSPQRAQFATERDRLSGRTKFRGQGASSDFDDISGGFSDEDVVDDGNLDLPEDFNPVTEEELKKSEAKGKAKSDAALAKAEAENEKLKKKRDKNREEKLKKKPVRDVLTLAEQSEAKEKQTQNTITASLKAQGIMDKDGNIDLEKAVELRAEGLVRQLGASAEELAAIRQRILAETLQKNRETPPKASAPGLSTRDRFALAEKERREERLASNIPVQALKPPKVTTSTRSVARQPAIGAPSGGGGIGGVQPAFGALAPISALPRSPALTALATRQEKMQQDLIQIANDETAQIAAIQTGLDAAMQGFRDADPVVGPQTLAMQQARERRLAVNQSLVRRTGEIRIAGIRESANNRRAFALGTSGGILATPQRSIAANRQTNQAITDEKRLERLDALDTRQRISQQPSLRTIPAAKRKGPSRAKPVRDNQSAKKLRRGIARILTIIQQKRAEL